MIKSSDHRAQIDILSNTLQGALEVRAPVPLWYTFTQERIFFMSFDQLDAVRQSARARAVEDFDFFTNGVMGLRVPHDVCSSVQRAVEQGEQIAISCKRPQEVERALGAWLVVIGKGGVLTAPYSETFEWLFAEVLVA